MLEWKSEYETGVLLVDEQHKVLFGHANRLAALLDEEVIEPARADELIGFLETYVVEHFRAEEQCMHRLHCPAHQANMHAHAQFLVTWGKYRDLYRKCGADKVLLLQLTSTLEDWITDHIIRIDRRLKECTPPSGEAVKSAG